MSVNEDIAALYVTDSIDLLRLAGSERKEALRVLRLLERDLLRQLDKLPDPSATTIRAQRLRNLQQAVSRIIRTHFKQIRSASRTVLRQTAALTMQNGKEHIRSEVGVNLATITLSQETLKSVIAESIVGAPATEWWSRQAERLKRRFMDQIRIGVLAKEPIGRLRQRIRGTRAGGFKDGVMQATRREADSLIRTSVLHVANSTTEKMFQANSDVVRGVEALVTLDERTSDICIARSGASWDLVTGRSLPDSTRNESYPGSPPWHFQCRTILVPILKSFEEILGKKGRRIDRALNRLDQKKQSSIDGQVTGGLTFEQWLNKQGAARQKRTLGAGRLKLWKDGKISLSQLIDQRGRPRTIQQLMKVKKP